MSDHSAAVPASLSLPTRIISYAWGDSYVDELLSLAIPALLAPGNLPAVASQVKCELVLLSEERLFGKIGAHPAIKRVQELCPVRLIGLDDLITRSDKYGMALTYALHRAFADLGPAMTDAWLIFFNADFILADGSLRNLLGHLMRGERIVASPSYCTVKEEVVAELKRRLAYDPTVLAVPPREMAELILRHRHITIRGKTVNQARFHLLQADQFYWQVDDMTLVGQQMPVAIVGMRPQRYLPEPNSFWDHGLMLELCPDAEAKLLGDSDDFLMLELRSGGVAQEQIVPGSADPRDLAERMIIWVTPYQVSFAHRPLILHADDVPPAVQEAHQKLDAFVTKVLSFAPAFPSHLGHPQWDYHWPDFMKIRHAYLSTKLGGRTELEAPPAGMLAIDRLWWRLDAAEKAHARRIELLKSRLEEIDREVTEYAGSVLDEVSTADLEEQPAAAAIYAEAALTPAAQSMDAHLGRSILNAIELKLAVKRDEAERRKSKLQLAMTAAEQDYAVGEYDELRKARDEYQQLVRPRVTSAGIPIVYWRTAAELHSKRRFESVQFTAGQPLFDLPWFQLRRQSAREAPLTPGPHRPEGWHRSVVRRAYVRVFGRWPHVSIVDPFWSSAQPLLAAIKAAKDAGARDALVVANAPEAFLGLSALSGKIAHMLPAGLRSELFSKAIERREQFDLCVLQLSVDDLPRLAKLVALLAPYMRKDGTIIGFYVNSGRPVGVLALDARTTRIEFTGSAVSMRAIRNYSTAFARIYRGRVLSMARGLVMLASSMPLAWWANRAEAAASKKGAVPDPRFRTSVTITVRGPWPGGDLSSGAAEYANAG
jgi:hypothetical protein